MTVIIFKCTYKTFGKGNRYWLHLIPFPCYKIYALSTNDLLNKLEANALTWNVLNNLFTLYKITILTISEAATESVQWEKVMLGISQNSQENTCASVSFLTKLQAVLSPIMTDKIQEGPQRTASL